MNVTNKKEQKKTTTIDQSGQSPEDESKMALFLCTKRFLTVNRFIKSKALYELDHILPVIIETMHCQSLYGFRLRITSCTFVITK